MRRWRLRDIVQVGTGTLALLLTASLVRMNTTSGTQVSPPTTWVITDPNTEAVPTGLAPAPARHEHPASAAPHASPSAAARAGADASSAPPVPSSHNASSTPRSLPPMRPTPSPHGTPAHTPSQHGTPTPTTSAGCVLIVLC